ncbi:histidine kinase [Acinetobacter sp. NCu2D-2]|uniref:CBS domain-containing protein n=1 Tax=Acinetobacter sp. NCu2D-2 TaxID=1608473 RepID=UPI0007CDE0AE|nr:CBS domain-containing protein [Acinetobacter sp. NCu2D-2]ANF81849.1 histidine kinase [Acinetobacter sp. NCu2D-2]
MTKVAQVLLDKPSQNIYTIHPEATVLEAITIMAEKDIGVLVVTHEENVVGILSERDYTRKIVLMERSSFDTMVSQIMTEKVLTVSKSTPIEDGLKLMTDKHLRHLPVIEDGKLVGLVSIGDLVKAAMKDQQNLIDQLQQYISG